jgi:hypothetical protein
MDIVPISRPIVLTLLYAYFGLVTLTPIVFVLRLFIPGLKSIPLAILGIGLALGPFLSPGGARLPAPSTPNYQRLVLKRRSHLRLKRFPRVLRPSSELRLAWEIIEAD